MFLTIIDGSLNEFIGDNEDGYVTVFEPDENVAFNVARRFVGYGKTVVIEPDTDGE